MVGYKVVLNLVCKTCGLVTPNTSSSRSRRLPSRVNSTTMKHGRIDMADHHAKVATADGNRTEAQAVAAGGRRAVRRRHNYHLFSGFFALATAVGVPFWFLLVAPWWNKDYVPVTPPVWAVPGIACILYMAAQVYWLLRSATSSSEDIGIGDLAVSLISCLSCFGTLIAIVIFWALDKYVLGWFQIMTILTINLTTFLELLFTAWIRYLVNRRYFAGVSSQSS
jgi:hypothetical protein